MTVSVRLGITSNRIPAILRALRNEASAIVRESAFSVQSIILDGMSDAKSGRLYGSHQASAPGESPAVDTGTLIGSIAVDAEVGRTWAEVSAGTEYAAHLEYGTVQMEARPFMVPAVEAERPNFERRFRNLESRLE